LLSNLSLSFLDDGVRKEISDDCEDI